MRDKDKPSENWKERDRSCRVGRRTIGHRARHQNENEKTHHGHQIASRDVWVDYVQRAEENNPGDRHARHVVSNLCLHMNKNPRPGYAQPDISAFKKLNTKKNQFTLRHPPKRQSHSASAELRY